MVTLIDKLKFLYPNAEALLFGVADDGSGQKIANWQQSFPEPTQADIDTVSDADVDAVKYQATIPTVVSMRQARLYLNGAGLLAAVTSQANAMGGEAQIVWEYSQEVQRSNPLIASMSAALGWTEDQLDQMFIDASKL